MNKHLYILFVMIYAALLCHGNVVVPVNTHTSGMSATVSKHRADQVMDANNFISIRSRDVPGSHRMDVGILGFDLSGVKVEILAARLKLGLMGTPIGSFSINVFGVTDKESAWDQETVTFNTAPGLTMSDRNLRTLKHQPSKTKFLFSFDLDAVAPNSVISFEGNPEFLRFLNDHAGGMTTLLLQAGPAAEGEEHFARILSGQRGSSGSLVYPSLILTEARDNPRARSDWSNQATAHLDSLADSDLPWPSTIEPKTGRRIHQLTSRPGHNSSLYYLLKNNGSVDGVPYLVYRNSQGYYRDACTFFSLNLETGEELELTEYGMVGFTAEAVGEYMYCVVKHDSDDEYGLFSHISRFHLKTGEEERLIELDPEARYSANISVNADGTKILFFRTGDILCGIVADGSIHKVSSPIDELRMSHIQFSPVDPNFFIGINQRHFKDWRRMALGWVDFENDRVLTTFAQPVGPFWDAFDGHLVPAHAHWDADGVPFWNAVDVSRPYVNEFDIGIIPNPENPGEILGYKKVLIRMGEFQTHYNAGPTAEWFVGDGQSADWWHKPGYDKPYIHKMYFDYDRGIMTQIPLASSLGTYWQMGDNEANARYMPLKDWVVWQSFRTLEGEIPPIHPLIDEAEELILFTDLNPISKNVFAVDFRAEDVTGWDFSESAEGWSPAHDVSRFFWTDGGFDQAMIGGIIDGPAASVFSHDNIGLACEDFTYLLIRAKHTSEAQTLSVWFTTEQKPMFDESQRVEVELDSSESGFKSYLLDLSQHPDWEGHVRRLKVVFPGAESGEFEIQVVRFVN